MICPLDFRYGRDEIKKIFSEESRLAYWLMVEGKLAEAHAYVGNISKEAAEEIKSKANLNYVKLSRVKKIEKEIHHDVMAMVKALAEQCKYGKYVHLGATSYDIVDTSNALQIKDALKIIKKQLIELDKILINLARKYRDVIMIGRTHGQHALPITFGFKMAVFASEIHRHIKRLENVEKIIAVGKISGAVGSGAAFGGKFFEIQSFIMKELGLGVEMPATQIVGRDRYIDLFSFLANLASSLEKFATEIRNLQRSEIGEVEEFFEEKQVGSSTMPHKRNPITCEQICGLARIIRSNVIPAWENAIQWHERDLCNSSSERFMIPHSLVLTDWILYQSIKVFSNLRIYPERMEENIQISKGLPMAEAVMIAMVEKGMSRQEAHELLRKYSMEAREKNIHLKEILARGGWKEKLNLDELFNPENYIGKAKEIVDIVTDRLSKELEGIEI